MRQRIESEVAALLRCFTLTKDNDNREKILTWILLLVWGAITVGIAFGMAERTDVYTTLTGLVWFMFGRTWGWEAASGGAE